MSDTGGILVLVLVLVRDTRLDTPGVGFRLTMCHEMTAVRRLKMRSNPGYTISGVSDAMNEILDVSLSSVFVCVRDRESQTGV